jgi:hypothetical protein
MLTKIKNIIRNYYINTFMKADKLPYNYDIWIIYGVILNAPKTLPPSYKQNLKISLLDPLLKIL